MKLHNLLTITTTTTVLNSNVTLMLHKTLNSFESKFSHQSAPFSSKSSRYYTGLRTHDLTTVFLTTTTQPPYQMLLRSGVDPIGLNQVDPADIRLLVEDPPTVLQRLSVDAVDRHLDGVNFGKFLSNLN